MANQKTSYQDAISRIEEIVDIVENQEPDVDALAKLVNECTELIELCKNKLRNTKEELNASLEKLGQID